jgi:hypothetical protein
MKRITMKEIFIEIETIRITRKRSVRKKPAERTKADDPDEVNSFAKHATRFEHRFGKHF